MRSIYNAVVAALLTALVIAASSLILNYYVSLYSVSNRVAVQNLAGVGPGDIVSASFFRAKIEYETKTAEVNVTQVGLVIAVPNVIRFKLGCLHVYGRDAGVRAGVPGDASSFLVASGEGDESLICGNIVAYMPNNCTVIIEVYNLTGIRLNGAEISSAVLNARYLISLVYNGTRLYQSLTVEWPWVTEADILIHVVLPSLSTTIDYFRRYPTITCQAGKYNILVFAYNYQLQLQR